MELTKSISKNFVVLPARWQADRARELILSHPKISHAIVATEPGATFYSPTDAVELTSGKDWFDIPKINIEMTQRPWQKLGLSRSGRLYVVRRDELVGLDDEEREKILKMLIRLREWRPAPLVSANNPSKAGQELGVLFDEMRLTGILDAQMPKGGGVHVPDIQLTKGATELIVNQPGSSQPPSNIPPSGSGGKEPPSGDFNAFPRLDAPNELEPEEEFTAVVGYRPDPDPTLASSGPLQVKNPPPDATIRISVSAFGAVILNQTAYKLPLKMEAEATIRCVVEPAAEKVILFADYFYNSQLIGTAIREIGVNIPGGTATSFEHSESDPARFGTPTEASAVDMTVVITKIDDYNLKWEIEGPAVSKPIEIEHPISDAREFAWKILSELNANKTGIGAKSIIDYYSDLIRDRMPDEFFDALRKVHDVTKDRPIVLIHTDEMYVPWELAAVKPALDDAYGPRYLGAQAVVGRWLRNQKVQKPPPYDLPLKTVWIFASGYGNKKVPAALPQAPKEKETLKKKLTAYGLETKGREATYANVMQSLEGERRPGTAIHFAVHGQRNIQPEKSEEYIVTADGKKIPPSMLAGGLEETARFDFVFINACQIGTAAELLGVAGGFPGALIGTGAKAFLGPLWNVQDTIARKIAEAFYQKTLRKGVSVAQFLSEQRQRYTSKTSTTPLAYVFYGHPRLRVRKFEDVT
jgi:hypothetical protein